MVAIGNILEAVLLSDIDGLCVDSTSVCPRGPISRTIVYPCHGKRNQNFALNKRDGTLCFDFNWMCLTPRDNSNEAGAEIVQTPRALKRGSVWSFKNGTLVNRFGLCLEREKQKDNKWSTLIQAKCDPGNLWQKFHFA